ncbi:hypothetical protein Hanom_Chr11g01038541 [Helianthus anomalus]
MINSFTVLTRLDIRVLLKLSLGAITNHASVYMFVYCVNKS